MRDAAVGKTAEWISHRASKYVGTYGPNKARPYTNTISSVLLHRFVQGDDVLDRRNSEGSYRATLTFEE